MKPSNPLTGLQFRQNEEHLASLPELKVPSLKLIRIMQRQVSRNHGSQKMKNKSSSDLDFGHPSYHACSKDQMKTSLRNDVGHLINNISTH